MAWGYWNAHSLAPAGLGRNAAAAGPTLHALRSREHSLDRDRHDREHAAAPLSARVSSCPTPATSQNHLSSGGGGGGPSAGIEAASDWPGGGGSSSRTTSERNTLPRGKTPDGGGEDWLADRHHTLPRGKSDSETSAAAGSSGPWAIAKVRSEGEWCPACNSSGGGGSRVSFHSVKESSSGSAAAAGDMEPVKRKNGGGGGGSGGSTELLSSSLPTPPPPPFQAHELSYRV
jgi:hypothetical protein